MTSSVSLGEIAQVVDCEHKTAPSAAPGEEYAYSVGTPALRGSGIDFAQAKAVDRETYLAWSRRAELTSGDIVLAREAPVGGVGFVDGRTRVCLGQRTVLIRGTANVVNPKFLFYLLRSPKAQEWMDRHSEGSTVKHLNVADVRKLELDFMPPLAEQRRIAGVLGALDDLIETDRALMAYLDELAMTLFRATWDQESWIPIGELGEVTMGQSPPGSTYNEVGEGMVFYQGVRDFGDRYPTPRVYCSEPSRKAAVGDILIAVRAPIGETNVATEPTAFGRGLAALRARHPAVALRALRASLKTWSSHEGTGTVFSSISGPDLRSALVPSVPDPEFDARLQVLDDMHRALAEEIAQLAATRDDLLPLLMSGRVRVKDGAA